MKGGSVHTKHRNQEDIRYGISFFLVFFLAVCAGDAANGFYYCAGMDGFMRVFQTASPDWSMV